MEYLAELLKKKLSEQSDEELNRKWEELDSEFDTITTEIKEEQVMNELIVSEYKSLWRLEYWRWFFPHPDYDPENNGRIHLFGKFYWRK